MHMCEMTKYIRPKTGLVWIFNYGTIQVVLFEERTLVKAEEKTMVRNQCYQIPLYLFTNIVQICWLQQKPLAALKKYQENR